LLFQFDLNADNSCFEKGSVSITNGPESIQRIGYLQETLDPVETPSALTLNACSDGFSTYFDCEGESIEIPYETNDAVDVEAQIDVQVFAGDCETPATDGVINICIASNLIA
jgi:hypothetical protein